VSWTAPVLCTFGTASKSGGGPPQSKTLAHPGLPVALGGRQRGSTLPERSEGEIHFPTEQRLITPVIARLVRTRSDLLNLVNLVQQGQELIITSHGRPVARLTAAQPTAPSSSRRAWLAGLLRLRGSTATDAEIKALLNLRSKIAAQAGIELLEQSTR
jgi:prevent-host-death family protein